MGPFEQRLNLPPMRTPNTPTTLRGGVPTAATGGVRGEAMSTTPVDIPMQMTPEIPVISPDAVSFRHPEQVCGNCEYHGQDDMCAVLKMEVDPAAGCNAFEMRA